MGRLLPGSFASLLMCRPGSSQLGTPVAKRCKRGFLELYRVGGMICGHILHEDGKDQDGMKIKKRGKHNLDDEGKKQDGISRQNSGNELS